MRLIVTRPEEDAGPLRAKLEGLGHSVTVLPLLKIVSRTGVAIPDAQYQAVCATSANALRSAGDISAIKHLPAFTVGAQSLAAARQAGFVSTSAHGGDVAGLASFFMARLKPDNGPILYLAGAEVSGDLKGMLERAGFGVTKIVVYDAVPQRPENLDAALQAHDGVLLYSPRTARIFSGLAGKGANHLVHYCLSENVAAALPAQSTVRIAGSPDEASLLALLD